MSSDRQLNYVNNLQNRDQKLYYVDDASELNSINLEENDKIYAINDNKLFQMEIVDQEEELSGSIVSFNRRNNTKIKSLVANIEPIQDLHEYDNPWPAGGGKNLLFIDSKATGTLSGMTITSDDDFIYVNGTKYGATQNFINSMPITLPSGTYYVKSFLLSGTYTEGSTFNINLSINSTTHLAEYIMSSEKTFTLEAETTFYVNIFSSDNNVISNAKIGVVISKTNGIDKFYPYKNICPISGRMSATVAKTGKNLFPVGEWFNAYSASVNNKIIGNTSIFIKAGVYQLSFEYYVDGATSVVSFWRTYSEYVTDVNTSKQMEYFSLGLSASTTSWTQKSTTVSITKDGWFAIDDGQLRGGVHYKNIQLELGSTVTAYEPYTGNQISVTFPTTIYGGEDEVMSGKLKSTMGIFKFEDYSGNISSDAANANGIIRFVATIVGKKQGTANLISNLFSTSPEFVPSDTDKEMLSGFPSSSGLYISIKASRLSGDLITGAGRATAFRTWCTENGFEICYELAEPIEYQLTPQEITAFLGQNNIWSDIGDITVKIAEKGITAFELEPHI